MFLHNDTCFFWLLSETSWRTDSAMRLSFRFFSLTDQTIRLPAARTQPGSLICQRHSLPQNDVRYLGTTCWRSRHFLRCRKQVGGTPVRRLNSLVKCDICLKLSK